MALIKSTILAQISGSINGVTFAHNKGGAYARNRSIPSNPGTDRQDQVRTAMASLSNAWKYSLTQEQRVLWNNYGANTTVLNRLGDSIQLSGIAAFQRINLFRLSTLEEDMVVTPPSDLEVRDPAPTFVSSGVTSTLITPPTLDVTLAGGTVSGYALAYYYSGPLSPGINFYRGPYIAHGTQTVANDLVSINLTAMGNSEGVQGSKVAAKLTLYEVDTSLPIWTINTDPTLIPEPQ